MNDVTVRRNGRGMKGVNLLSPFFLRLEGPNSPLFQLQTFPEPYTGPCTISDVSTGTLATVFIKSVSTG